LTKFSFWVIDLVNRGFLPIYVPVFSGTHKLTYYLLIYLALYPKPSFDLRYKRVVLLQFIFAFLFQGLYYRHMAWDLKITLPYVDQGEAIILEHGNYCAMIDTGGSYIESYDPTRRYLLPHLNAMGITNIDDIFVTHGDEDHIGGLDTVLSKISVDSIYGYKSLAPTRQDITYINEIKLVRGLLHIQGLPLPEFSQDENDNSMPLLISFKNFNALFTGDLTTNVEKKIVHDIPEIALLKLGHHGSNTSTSNELLEQCKPKFAILSAGFQNPYGHPHEEVMNRLNDYGVKNFQTNQDGTIEIFLYGDDIYVQTYRGQAEKTLGVSDLILFVISGFFIYHMSNYLKRERGLMIELSKNK